MEEFGRVVECREGEAVVRINRHSACSKCNHQCGLAAANSHESDQIEVRVNNQANARKGQLVKLEMREGSLIMVTLIVYLFPLLSMIIGYFAGDWFFSWSGYHFGEGAGIIGSIIFLGAAFLLVRRLDELMGQKKHFHPEVKEVLERGTFW